MVYHKFVSAFQIFSLFLTVFVGGPKYVQSYIIRLKHFIDSRSNVSYHMDFLFVGSGVPAVATVVPVFVLIFVE